jgi:LEA14-like dessication related protein
VATLTGQLGMFAGKRLGSWGRWQVALAAAAVFAGCSLTRLQAPAVTPVAVDLAQLQLYEQQFVVKLHVQNPNDRTLPIKSVSCTLQIEGVEVGQGKITEPFTVPAHGETDVDMVVTTNIATSVPNLLRRLLERGQLPEYQLSGWVNPDISLIPPIPFSKSGQLTLEGRLTLAHGQPGIG